MVGLGSTEADVLVFLRNMMASSSFTQVTNSLESGALAASTMGDYAPRGVYCEKATYEQRGLPADSDPPLVDAQPRALSMHVCSGGPLTRARPPEARSAVAPPTLV